MDATHTFSLMTPIHTSNSSIREINKTFQTGTDNLISWAYENRMIIHPQKTQTMLIGSQRKLVTTTENLNIYLKESSIKQSDCEKLVGV